MYRKFVIVSILFFIYSFVASAATSYSSSDKSDEPADKIIVKLISPERQNSKLPKARVDTSPIVVKGIVSLGIEKTLSTKDVQSQRYLVEYFIDGELVFQTDGSNVESPEKPTFAWHLDTTKYRNGKHKLVVNFWDKEGPSAIGTVYIDVKNPLTVEQIKNLKIEEKKIEEPEEEKSKGTEKE